MSKDLLAAIFGGPSENMTHSLLSAGVMFVGDKPAWHFTAHFTAPSQAEAYEIGGLMMIPNSLKLVVLDIKPHHEHSHSTISFTGTRADCDDALDRLIRLLQSRTKEIGQPTGPTTPPS